MKKNLLAQEPPRPSSPQGGLFALEGRKAWNKRQKWEIEDKGEREGNKRKGTGVFVSEDNGLPLNREEIDMDHRQIEVCKGERGNPVLERGV